MPEKIALFRIVHWFINNSQAAFPELLYNSVLCIYGRFSHGQTEIAMSTLVLRRTENNICIIFYNTFLTYGKMHTDLGAYHIRMVIVSIVDTE